MTGRLVFNIFRKPTTTVTVILACSKQSNSIKHSVFHSLIHRLVNIPLNKNNFSKELHTIKQIAVNNGYTTLLIDNILRQKLRKRTRKLLYCNPPENSHNKNYVSLNYIPKVSEQIRNKIKKFDLKVIEVNSNKLSNFIVNNKNKRDPFSNSGVYQICCANCDAIYIGQSGRAIKTRIQEHKKCISKKQKSTGFSDHCISNNHTIDENNIKILHKEPKGRKLNFLENLEIKKALYKNLNIVNNHTEMCLSDSPLLLTAL